MLKLLEQKTKEQKDIDQLKKLALIQQKINKVIKK